MHTLKRETGEVILPSLTLESGIVLNEVRLVYERIGKVGTPVVLICHALTGNESAYGTEKEHGWWRGLFGRNHPFDPEKRQMITFNVLGGCHGSTGPMSDCNEVGKTYRHSFPAITIRDMVTAEKLALNRLGIHHVKAIIGGSLGGMKVLEWGILYPGFADVLFVLACTPTLSDYGMAFNHIGIRAIESDPSWKQGDYEDSFTVHGLEIARMVGLVTYRSDALFNQRFKRRKQVNPEGNTSSYEVQSYLDYQGNKLKGRFDPNSYLTLLKAMNSHDIGRGRGGVLDATAFYQAKVVVIGYTNDLLYPVETMQNWVKSLPNGIMYVVKTLYGHDGFLTELANWESFLTHHLEEEKNEFTSL